MPYQLASRANRPSRQASRAFRPEGKICCCTDREAPPWLQSFTCLINSAGMANHADTRTTRLYDQCAEDVSLDDVERISI